MQQDQRLVSMALERGYVTAEQVERARAEQRTLADRGVEAGVYFLLQDLGFLSDEHARELRKSVSSSFIRALEVDGFVLQGRLGSGGMGDVFRSRHADGRVAAVKLLSTRLAQNKEYLHRFEREAEATLRLQHPHIVRSLGAGESLGTRYLLMELVEGPSLKTWIAEKGRLDPVGAVTVLRQMARALRYAWSNGVLHRDVKPANIILGAARPGVDEPFCAKLCDFGLARVWEGDNHGQLTGTGLALGTPHYMSPEQASGEHDLDQRSDIYGLGASIYHAVLGHTMYSGKSSAVIMYKQVTENLDLGELRAAGLAPALVDLLGAMLMKKRDERIASWDLVLERAARLAPPEAAEDALRPTTRRVALRSTGRLAQPDAPSAEGPAPSAGPPTGASRRRSWVLALLVAVSVALAAAAVAGAMLLSWSGPPVATPATLAAALADAAGEPSGPRVVRLAPGRYDGPLRLGIAQREVRLVAIGAGVRIVSAQGPAIIAEPGLTGAEIVGIELVSESASPAVEVAGGAQLILRRLKAGSRGQFALRVAGGTLDLLEVGVDGGVRVGELGRLGLTGGSVRGLVEIEQASCQVEHGAISGGMTVRQGQLSVDGLELGAPSGIPALVLDGARVGVLAAVRLSSSVAGLVGRQAELPLIRGLAIRSQGPAIDWLGPRDPAWRWEGLDLEGSPAPVGLPAATP